jgi:hypothetical protein
MKHFSFVVALIVSALVIGCQDSGNDPISASNSSAPKLSKMTNPDGIINLKHVVYKGESVGVPEEYLVSGNIGYTLVPFDGNRYVLSLVTEAQVQNGASKAVGSAYGESMEEFEILEGAILVNQSFQVRAGNEWLRLYIELKVAAESVELASVSIADDMAGRAIRTAQ